MTDNLEPGYVAWLAKARDYAKRITSGGEPPLPDDEFEENFQFGEVLWWRPLWMAGMSPEEAVKEEMSYWETDP